MGNGQLIVTKDGEDYLGMTFVVDAVEVDGNSDRVVQIVSIRPIPTPTGFGHIEREEADLEEAFDRCTESYDAHPVASAARLVTPDEWQEIREALEDAGLFPPTLES